MLLNSRFTILFLVMSGCAGSGLAQDKDIKFGDVSIDELTMKKYPNDSSADAIVLFDKGSVVWNPGNRTAGTVFKRHVRIKIFRKRAFQDNPELAIVSVLGERGSVTKIRGVTYNLVNGEIQRTEMDDGAVFHAREGKYWEKITFTLPNLQEGSVIEYSYAEKSDGFYYYSWKFQTIIPTKWSEFVFDCARARYQMKSNILGLVSTIKHESQYDGALQRWTASDVPAFRVEPLMPQKNIYESGIYFWDPGDNWFGLCQRLRRSAYFGSIFERNSAVYKFKSLENKTDELVANLSSARDKIKAISEYLKKSIAWDGTREIYGDDPSLVFGRATGSCADINLIFGAMLDKAGVNTKMVLLSTRDHGFIIEAYPSMRQFDYVLCQAIVDQDTLYLDATDRNLPYHVIPKQCLNYTGLVLDFQTPYWGTIKVKTKATTASTCLLNVTEEDELDASITYTRDGYDAQDTRNDCRTRGKELYVADLMNQRSWQMDSSRVDNLDDITKPVKETYRVHIRDQSMVNGDLIYVNPFVSLHVDNKPFVSDIRIYPILLGALQEKSMACTVMIPAGYSVEEAPASKVLKVDNNSAKCTIQVSQFSDRVSVFMNLQVNKTLFAPNEYVALRDFYARVVGKMGEQITFKKTK